MIRFACESCTARYRVELRQAGRLAKCRKCEAVFPIPLPVLETRLAGTTRANRGGQDRQELIGACRPGDALRLQADGTVDPHAVAVCNATGEPLGYLETELASHVHDWLTDRRLRVRAEVVQIARPVQHGLGPGQTVPLEVSVRIEPCRYLAPGDAEDLTVAQEVRNALDSHDLTRIRESLVREPPSLVERHFLLQEVFQYALHRRNEVAGMRDLCQHVAQLHFDEYPALARAFKERWSGPMPAVSTFADLAELLADERQFDEAVDVCRKAIALGQHDRGQGGFAGRIERIRKLEKQAAMPAPAGPRLSKHRIRPIGGRPG